jgi:hypothetical protein
MWLEVIYDFSGTNRRDGGSTSCRGHSRKLRAYTSKELETMRAAPELLGVPTMGGGSARPGGGGGESYRSQISLQSHPKYTKTSKNGRFHELVSLQIAENASF